MRAAITLPLFSLLAVALATPRHHHKHGHHASGHASVSGIPYPLGNQTNVTALSGSFYSTLYLTTTATVAAASTSVVSAGPDSDVADVQDKVGVEQASAANDASNDACNAVTVTYNPTVTITVSPSSDQVAPAAATSQAAPISSASAPPTASSPPSNEIASSSPSNAVAASAVASSSAVDGTVAAATPSSSPVTSAPSVQSNAPSLPPSPATPATSPSASASSNNTAIGTKRGIIASGSNQQALVSALTPYVKISWLGDWYSGPPTNLPTSMQFVPQNYGRQSDVNGEWTSNAKKAVAAGDKYFLSFGEPGTPNAQLYMDPQDAVNLFMEKMQPYAEQGVSIGAPGTLQNDQDFAWLTSFLNGCETAGCKIGFLAMHWFWTAEADHVQGFKDTLAKNVALAKGKPVWVDNFQAAGSVADQKEFLQEVVPWLDQQDTVARYAYVPVDPGNGQGFLNDGGKTLSELGEFYATL